MSEEKIAQFLKINDSDNLYRVWPTLTELGAAPGGQGGFGEVIMPSSFDDEKTGLEPYLSSIISDMNVNTSVRKTFIMKPLTGNSSWTWFATIDKTSNNYAIVQAHTGYNKFSEIRKVYQNSVWQPLEWINPPMQEGVEYRTIERWDNKPVYRQQIKKTVDKSQINVSTQKDVPISHGISNVSKIIECKGFVNSQYPLPYIQDKNAGIFLNQLTTSSIVLRLTPTISAFTNDTVNFYFDLKYTKTTN